jgi:transcriptional regulator with PAS, ATPase and Fis domain
MFLKKDTDKLSLKKAANTFQKKYIIEVLMKTDYDRKKAARLLGLSLSSLYRKIKELGIEGN